MGIWASNPNASLVGGVAVLSNMVQAEGGTGSIHSVSGAILPTTASGNFARLTINVGNNVAPGDYPLKLKDIPSLPRNSVFLDDVDPNIDIQTDIENGIIRVVPEPASAVLFVGLLGGLLPMRRRRVA